MPTTKQLTIENVNLDNPQETDAFFEQVISAGIKRVRADVAALQAGGLMDHNGKLLPSELPPDMREGAERDFGG
jgi:hypothetical protein